MTDASLVRVLQAQCRERVGLVAHPAVAAGPDAIRARMAALAGQGRRIAIVDAITDQDLMAIGRACDGLPLVTGASGRPRGSPTISAGAACWRTGMTRRGCPGPAACGPSSPAAARSPRNGRWR
jgi:hypothetical protein